MFAWPGALKLDTQEKTLLNLFLSNVAGDATTNLYKMFVDTKTRVMETGAKSVFGFLDDEMVVGNPVYVGLTDVAPANMTEEKIAEIRQKIMDELKRVASFADGSAELNEFNERLKNRVIQNAARALEVRQLAAGLRLPQLGRGLDVAPRRPQPHARLPQVGHD